MNGCVVKKCVLCGLSVASLIINIIFSTTYYIDHPGGRPGAGQGPRDHTCRTQWWTTLPRHARRRNGDKAGADSAWALLFFTARLYRRAV
jgi:hypothetical protein